MTRRLLLGIIGAIGVGVSACGTGDGRLAEVRARVEPGLKKDLRQAGLRYGAPVFIRIFKEESELELWLQSAADGPYEKFQTYSVASWGSGSLGPKLKEGDGQAPEGFYAVPASAMNPNSSFHLSFNLGFPNAFDRHHHRTGSFLMVHGSDVSIGCYAMTDPVIERIFLVVGAAHAGGQTTVPVHCFPFRMTAARLRAASRSPWHPFWTNLQSGYDLFEQTGHPPGAELDPATGNYTFTPAAPGA